MTSGCTDEQWNLYGRLTTPCPDGQPRPDGGLPCWAPLARDPQHAAGVDMTGAWGQGNVGRPDVLIAYIEGGVNYDSDNIKDGLDHIYLNKRELPLPERTDGSTSPTYDLNGDGRVDVPDYAEDPRVNPPISVSGQFIGDYQGIAADDDVAIPFWNDTQLANLPRTDRAYSRWQEVLDARIPNDALHGGPGCRDHRPPRTKLRRSGVSAGSGGIRVAGTSSDRGCKGKTRKASIPVHARRGSGSAPHRAGRRRRVRRANPARRDERSQW